MKSQELIHFHALLLEVRSDLERRDAVPPDAFAAYDAQPIRPSHIHRPKEAHERAVSLLLDDIERSLRPSQPEESPLLQ